MQNRAQCEHQCADSDPSKLATLHMCVHKILNPFHNSLISIKIYMDLFYHSSRICESLEAIKGLQVKPIKKAPSINDSAFKN